VYRPTTGGPTDDRSHIDGGELLDRLLREEGSRLELELTRASLLGLQARYGEASEVLLKGHRQHPHTPAILKRLVLVFEQLRDTGKALAFLRADGAAVPGDAWAREKMEHYRALGLA
jgi:serine/threonine-protein kinase